MSSNTSKTNSKWFELSCIVLLGLGQMCIMTGYDTQSFVQESALHSVSLRYPEKIDGYAGYYGQAACYSAYMISCIISPWLMEVLTPKWTLFISSICYTLYHIGFFFLNSYYYYISSAVMGFGFALFYSGNGGYLTSHSTRSTLERNASLSWSIGSGCLILGGGILCVIFTLTKDIAYESSNLILNATLQSHSAAEQHKYRNFSDTDISYMYGSFALITIIANIIFALMPSTEIDNCIEGKDKPKSSFTQQISVMGTTFLNPRMLQLAIYFLHLGFYTAFWVSVLPTTLVFTKSLSNNIYLPAFYAIAVGSGEIIMGTFIGTMSRRIPNFGLRPTLAISSSLFLILLIIMISSIPPLSTITPTSQTALLIQSNAYLSLFVAFLIGLIDSCQNSMRAVICALALPKRRPQAFSISKFYQSLGGTVLMLFSPYLTSVHYCILMLISSAVATYIFSRVAAETQKMEKKLSLYQIQPVVNRKTTVVQS